VVEFFLDGRVVGYFKESVAPATPGRYGYEPYRGPGHLQLSRRLSARKPATCTYSIGNEQVTFTVISVPDYGTLDLERFSRERLPVDDGAARSWADLQSVLKGTLRPPVDALAEKMLRIMLLAPCDVLLQPDMFELWYVANGRRHRYLASLMAPVVSDLMMSINVRELSQATVGVPGGLPSGSVTANSRSFAVWIVPGDEQVSVFMRESPEGTRPVSAMSAPTEGPWALPSPARRKAPKEVSATCPCPHCGRSPSSFRMLSDEVSLVCEACGRSFVPG
jgi:hypothetical protein